MMRYVELDMDSDGPLLPWGESTTIEKGILWQKWSYVQKLYLSH